MSFELRIGALVVDGVPADPRRIGRVVERELGRLAAERGVPHVARRGASVGRIEAGPVGAGSATLGVDLARAIWEALER